MINKWKEYLDNFEMAVLIPMYEKNSYDINLEPVPLRAGKLHKTQFAKFVGKHFVSSHILSFNYYGLFKPSTGLITRKPQEHKSTISAPVIHFSSVKLEHIEAYHKEMLLDFVSFKKFLVSLRWEKQ